VTDPFDGAVEHPRAPGVFVKVFRRDPETGATTAVLRFTPGARFPAHRHPAGEEVLVVRGEVKIGNKLFRADEYCYTPPDGVHAAWSESGCDFLVVLPKPVEILAR
jgi:quercetin dioxygenase-like cupin family protein